MVSAQAPGDQDAALSSGDPHVAQAASGCVSAPATSFVETYGREALLARMVGDVNVFLSLPDEPFGTVPDADALEAATTALEGEMEIMIANRDARRSGFAVEALRLMMAYGMVVVVAVVGCVCGLG